jgi:hypothetical protein
MPTLAGCVFTHSTDSTPVARLSFLAGCATADSALARTLPYKASQLMPGTCTYPLVFTAMLSNPWGLQEVCRNFYSWCQRAEASSPLMQAGWESYSGQLARHHSTQHKLLWLAGEMSQYTAQVTLVSWRDVTVHSTSSLVSWRDVTVHSTSSLVSWRDVTVHSTSYSG